MKSNKVKRNEITERYEMVLDNGRVAFINYYITPDGNVALTHTDVPYGDEGQGVGSELVKQTLEEIEGRNSKVIPSCSFVAAYIRRHPEWKRLVVEYKYV